MTTLSRPPVAYATTVLDLIDRARACLLSACRCEEVDDRFRNAQLAALRATAAILAARSEPDRRGGPRSAWAVLRRVAPELAEWADFFESTGRRLQACERGSLHFTLREADDHVREAETYLGIVLGELGLPLGAHTSSGLARTAPGR